MAELKFEKLYQQTKEAVRDTLLSMWCSEANSQSQRAYAEQIASKIDELFAPEYAMPLVQCMNSYETIDTELRDQLDDLIGNLWQKSYDPYQHQYECWKVLNDYTIDGKCKSICVTTGTGSGKTECFMLPLVNELKQAKDNDETGIQAIFLYPLNALMEDQKKRLDSILKNTGLRFAVYNGNMPETDDEEDIQLHDRILEERRKFPSIVPTRKEMRDTPPEIILTNPTMLEYMLLRDKDQNLFQTGNLKWIVIDETHTYSGAGAAELAMLLRRVILAFGANVDKIRFATSSATIGNSDNSDENEETTRKQHEAAINKLKRYICDLSGQTEDQVEIIEGKRVMHTDTNITDFEILACQERLFDNEYIPLDQLIVGDSIESRLSRLDEYCENGLKAKVHFFNRVPTTGLRVKVSDHENGCFKIYTETPLDESENDEPYLELMRCASCGEYFAVGQVENGKLCATSYNDVDIFSENTHSGEKLIFSLTDTQLPSDNDKDTTSIVTINGNRMDVSPFRQGWNILKSSECNCPHCASDLRHKESDAITDLNEKKTTSFRLNSSFISRIIAPVILNNVREDEEKPEEKPHKGQQFLSFVDSRQAAAKATMAQNLEEERLWVYSRIFHELIHRKQDGTVDNIGWTDIYNLLSDSEECDRLCLQFTKRSKSSDEIDDLGHVSAETKKNYIHSVMYQLLGRRPLEASSPENMGLFTSYYPLLNQIDSLPNAVEEFNRIIPTEENKISVEDWRDYLKLFMDHNMRANLSVFLKGFDEEHRIRYQTIKAPTKPFQKVKVEGGSIFVKLLTKLLNLDYSTALSKHKVQLQNVIDAIQTALVDIHLIEHENPRDNDENNLRLNLTNLHFKLFDIVYFCDVNRYGPTTSIIARPFEILFKGFSPILKKGEVVRAIDSESYDWTHFPYTFGINDGAQVSYEMIQEWAIENRKKFFNYGLWGPYGVFSTRLTLIYSYPDIFIQAEHTAQIDKFVARQSQDMFINKEINILACSTTMEMGIDLGELEVVLLCSLPPSPANYKQRAGRSGRDLSMKRSVCITLCDSDSLGLRTLREPLNRMINRPIDMPIVDLNSLQIVQRHINAFLLRESGLMNRGTNQNNLDQQIIEFFTPFHFEKSETDRNNLDYTRVFDENQTLVFPDQLLGDEDKTRYYLFLDFLTSGDFNHESLNKLIIGTCLDDQIALAIMNCNTSIQRCYKELLDKIKDIGEGYNTVKKERQNRMKHSYSQILAKGLIDYFSTNRFTPNANMPVCIIEFDINFNNTRRNWNNDTASNPSQTLQTALSQYVPGNTVVLGNRARIVRGIRYTGIFRHLNVFKTLYNDGKNILMDKKPEAPIVWSVNNREGLILVQPYAFMPDINETDTREVTSNRYTRVDAQLINATDWSDETYGLMKFRTSEDCKNSKILYYNAGIGYGYRMCRQCGKTELEYSPMTNAGVPDITLLNLHNSSRESRGETIQCHYYIDRKTNGRRVPCCDISNTRLIHKNIIIGDFIQTDFCEIKFKHNSTDSQWIKRDDKGLLCTIAIAFTRCLVEYLGVEPRDISFTITPDGSIVIFDTNQGGSGYSKRLGVTSVMDYVLDASIKLLESLQSKDDLLDKFTLRYIEDIKPQEALALLLREKECARIVPENILNDYPEAKCTSFSEMLDDCESTSANPTILFVNNNWNSWNYKNDAAEDWNYRIQYFKNKYKCILFIVAATEPSVIPPAIYNVINRIRDWATVKGCVNQLATGYYPIAYIGNRLYFVVKEDASSLDFKWGKANMYYININLNFDPIDIPEKSPQVDVLKKFKISSNDDNKCSTTTDLPKLVEGFCNDIVDQFVQYVGETNAGEIIDVIYQDEHLKSCIGIVATLNFIGHFLHKFGRKFTLRFNIEEYDYNYYYGQGPKITGDLSPSDRDSKLKELVDEWTDTLDIKCTDKEMTPKDKKSLPHWRVLSFKCGNKQLCFYPNGGIINEWYFDTKKNKENHGKYLTYDNISIADVIPLYHYQEIMYDVQIEDIP